MLLIKKIVDKIQGRPWLGQSTTITHFVRNIGEIIVGVGMKKEGLKCKKFTLEFSHA